MDAERRCLEPFFITKGERGTGLGLAMVYGMVRCLRPIAWCLIWALAAGCGDAPSGPNPNTGRLTVEITGLPAGVDASVQVDGPGNYAQLVPQTKTFAELAPGAYVVTAAQVTAGATTYVPLPATQTVNVATDAQETATVTYAP